MLGALCAVGHGGRKQGKELQAGQNSTDPNSHIHLEYTKLSKPNTVERRFKNKLVTTEKNVPPKSQTTNKQTKNHKEENNNNNTTIKPPKTKGKHSLDLKTRRLVTMAMFFLSKHLQTLHSVRHGRLGFWCLYDHAQRSACSWKV